MLNTIKNIFKKLFTNSKPKFRLSSKEREYKTNYVREFYNNAANVYLKRYGESNYSASKFGGGILVEDLPDRIINWKYEGIQDMLKDIGSYDAAICYVADLYQRLYS